MYILYVHIHKLFTEPSACASLDDLFVQEPVGHFDTRLSPTKGKVGGRACVLLLLGWVTEGWYVRSPEYPESTSSGVCTLECRRAEPCGHGAFSCCTGDVVFCSSFFFGEEGGVERHERSSAGARILIPLSAFQLSLTSEDAAVCLHLVLFLGMRCPSSYAYHGGVHVWPVCSHCVGSLAVVPKTKIRRSEKPLTVYIHYGVQAQCCLQVFCVAPASSRSLQRVQILFHEAAGVRVLGVSSELWTVVPSGCMGVR